MAITVTVDKFRYTLNSLLYENLKGMQQLIAGKFDNVLVIDGMEGYGKTELGFTCCHFLSGGRFSNKDIVFTPEEFEGWVDSDGRKPGDALLWDEFALAGMSADAMTSIQKAIIKKMVVIRKKGLHIVLVIPYFFMLRRYFAIARSRNLIHVYSDHGLERGKFKFFNYQKKKKLYLRGLKEWDYNREKPNFSGYFWRLPEDIIDREAYELHKDHVTKALSEGVEKGRVVSTRMMKQRDDMLLYLNESKGLKQQEIAQIIGLGRSTVANAIAKAKRERGDKLL